MLLIGLICVPVGVLLIIWARRRSELGIKPQPREDLRPVFEALDAEPIEDEPKVDATGRLHGKGGRFAKK